MKKVRLILFFVALLWPVSVEPMDHPFFLERPNPAAKIKTDFDIHPYIKKAKELLANQKSAGYRVAHKNMNFEMENFLEEKTRISIKKGGFAWYEVILAVMNVDERKIKIIRTAPYDGPAASPTEFEIGWYRLNGLNTPFRVLSPAGYVVLAIRRTVRIEGGFHDRIYVPFAPELDTPRLRKEGLEYIFSLSEVAAADLREKKVLSRAFEGKLLTDVVPSELVIALANIEHIDHDRFASTPADELVSEVLVTLALNREDTYRYSASAQANARGIMQFIRDTYNLMVNKYPEARLLANFISGTADHKNSAKASLLLFDSDLQYLIKSDQGRYLREYPEELHSYLVSAYNCGSGRTKKEIAKWKKGWRNHVPLETRIFLKKFETVRKLFELKRQTALSNY